MLAVIPSLKNGVEDFIRWNNKVELDANFQDENQKRAFQGIYELHYRIFILADSKYDLDNRQRDYSKRFK